MVRANANALVSSTEDLAKILDQALMDMESELVSLRQVVATAVASRKNVEIQLRQARDQVDQWYERASMALQEGNEQLAREALARCRPYEDTARTLHRQLESQAVQVEDLQRNLLKLEGRFQELKARLRSSK